VRTPHEVKELLNATGNIAVDGAIAVDMLGLVGQFNSTSHIPCVSIATIKRSLVDHVLIDLSAGVKEAVNLMLADGRQRVAYLVTSEFMTRDAEVRARAYREALQTANRVPEVIDVMAETPTDVEKNLKTYIEENGCPDALLCQNDETAMSAFRVFKALGYKVPSDVLLVGCDGHPHMQDFEPPLSTIVQPMEELCAKAWEFLQNRIAQPDLPHQEATFEGTLVVRESLGALTPIEEQSQLSSGN
jgi:DNA-binding LacI/PurR family transcriptional regulator